MSTAERAGPGARYWTGFAAAMAACLLLIAAGYRWDNKYAGPALQGEYGVLLLEDGAEMLRFLTTGWELYRGRALSPGEIAGEGLTPDAYVYLNQYRGLEQGGDESPHGSATYRLTLFVGEEPREYALELPEIFSSYALWVNGVPLAGSPAERQATFNGAVSFQAGGRIELVVAVEDHSHFYSGMVYPPAFGGAQAVQSYLLSRLALRLVFCITALLVGAMQLFGGIAARSLRTAGLYALLCLSFVGTVCYPVAHLFSPLWVKGWYAFENCSRSALYLLVTLVCGRICGLRGRLLTVTAAAGGCACLLSAAAPFLLGDSLPAMLAYSWMTSLYKIWVVVFLITGTALALRRGTLYAGALLPGVSVFGLGLAADLLLPEFESGLLGTPVEQAGFLLVVLLGGILMRETMRVYLDYRSAREDLDRQGRQLVLQAQRYHLLLEHIGETRKAHHDLRHHLAVLAGLADGETAAYLESYRKSLPDEGEMPICGNPAVDALAHYYRARAAELDVRMELELEVSENCGIADTDLSIVFGNCVENALEACRRMPEGEERRIRVKAGIIQSSFLLVVRNSFSGPLEQRGGRLLSAKRGGTPGIGTASVAAVARKYGGEARFETEDGEFKASVVLAL